MNEGVDMASASVIARDMDILEGMKKFGIQSARKLGEALGISKDKVQRGMQALSKREVYPESGLWETPEGYAWLRTLVFAVLLEFGIKGNQGADRISDFFKRVHLDKRIGVSPTALRRVLQRMEEELARYQQIQESQVDGKGHEIIASGDETFFKELMILVLMDLSSGYIVVEEGADDRSYETWEDKANSRLRALNLKVRHLVSDRAKSLIKLALKGLGCKSGADIFHAQHDISKWLGLALYRHAGSISKFLRETRESFVAHISHQEGSHFTQKREQRCDHDKKESGRIEAGKQAYSEAQQGVSKAVHPFSLNTNSAQTSTDVQGHLEEQARRFEEIAQTYAIDDPKNVLDKFRKQIEDIASIVDVWWLWARESLIIYDLDKEKQDWLLYILLPVVYWHQQAERTQHSELKSIYNRAWEKALAIWEHHMLTLGTSHDEIHTWLAWAEWIASKFQRASSAVEGRNGQLAQMHHNGRGLTTRRLRSLTVIRNFDSRRRDGTTAAERLFQSQFPDLFDWLVEHMGELPLPRSGRQCHVSNPLKRKPVAG
jgi:hypothetical protein